MKFRILKNEPLEFYNESGDLTGQVTISGSGDLIIRAESGSRDVIIGDNTTTGDVEIGTTAAPVTLKLMGGGTITGNGSNVYVGSAISGEKVFIYNAVYSQSLQVVGSVDVTGSVFADNFIGNGSGLSGIEAFPYTGSAEITGSLTVTGSVAGAVQTLAIVSSTASLDLSQGNFFELTLESGSVTHLSPTNIQPGQTINLKITQPATSGSLTYDSALKFPGGISYNVSATGSVVDILSMVSFDSSTLYTTAIKNLS